MFSSFEHVCAPVGVGAGVRAFVCFGVTVSYGVSPCVVSLWCGCRCVHVSVLLWLCAHACVSILV